MTLAWITVARGVMAIVLGLALALHPDRAPAALVNFMGVYWILSGIITFQWAWRRRAHAADYRSQPVRSGP
jgi:uncharacterized membrane protein HdeD (DUF308 family)